MIKQNELSLARASKDLNSMLYNRFGYRNEGYSSSGVTDVFEIIKFEMWEQGEENILDFFVANYGLKTKLRNYSNHWYEGVIKEKDVDDVINEMKKVLEDKFGHVKLSALWLTSLEGVKENYLEESSIYIKKVYFPEGLVIPISDGEDQGTLFVFEEDPGSFNYEEVKVV